jgi:hypothetical protein
MLSFGVEEMEILQQLKTHNHKKLAAVTAVFVATLLMTTALAVQAKPNGGRLKPGIDFSGPHFNLNVHGVPVGVDKFKVDSIGEGRPSIFVPGSAYDSEGNPISFSIEYAFSLTKNWTVLDCDATVDGTASIILPAYMYVDTDSDGIEEKLRVKYYMLYIAGLGKPSDDSMMIIEPQVAYNASWTAYQLNEDRLDVAGKRKGKPVWYNGTDLFFADVTFFNGTDYIDYVNQWIFDIPGLEGYWWQMTNNDVKMMQFRFYPVFA